jgi:hypothetical protein
MGWNINDSERRRIEEGNVNNFCFSPVPDILR